MNQKKVLISICIPAYKRVDQLRRLLQSISIQSFKDFEVVISDDSPDNSVQNLVNEFSHLKINYIRNNIALGTPANWNYAISRAKGEWIKIMHDDDWFSAAGSLTVFAEHSRTGKSFVFSAYTDVFESGRISNPQFTGTWKNRIIRNPVTLLARNVIGPPSVTMIHSSIREEYDTFLKWRVDIDLYIRLLKTLKEYSFIETRLVNVGISSTQVTNDCINVPGVELPEGLILLNKYGTSPLKHILVYDAWWRILRNTGIRSIAQIQDYTPYNSWPRAIIQMIKHQAYIPAFFLRMGVFSKLFMLISYFFNRRNLQS